MAGAADCAIALLLRQCSVSGCDSHYLASLVALAEETAGEVSPDHDTSFLGHLADGTQEGERLSLALLDAHHLLSAPGDGGRLGLGG